MRWWDVEPVAALERALFPADAWRPETFWSELAGVPSTRHYVVAVRADGAGDEVVGYAGLRVVRPSADVQTVAVRTDSAGRGLGARLLRHLLDVAAARGCTEVLLEVRADNAPARALYARHGFEPVSTRRGYYADGADALVLRRRGGAPEPGPAGPARS